MNELTANRKGNNRLFDSQNNAKGGYNVGDRLNTPHVDEQSRQYSMVRLWNLHRKIVIFNGIARIFDLLEVGLLILKWFETQMRGTAMAACQNIETINNVK